MRAVVFDTGIHVQEMYSHPSRVLQKLGWAVCYRSLEDSLKVGLNEVFKENPKLFIFVINDEFLRSTSDSVIGRFVREALARASSIEGGTTVLMVPALGTVNMTALKRIAPVFNALGLQSFVREWGGEGLDVFRKEMIHFVTHPFDRRTMRYHTALRGAKASDDKMSKQAKVFHGNGAGDVLFALPLVSPERFDKSLALATAFPMGLCYFDKERNHSFVFAHSSLMTTFGTAEDIHVFPLDRSLRKDFCAIVAAFWSDLTLWAKADTKPNQDQFAADVKASTKILNEVAGFDDMVVPHGSKRPLKTAWLEIVVFDETGKESKAELDRLRSQQKALVASLIDAGIDYAWISLSPQMYYGKHAKYPEKRTVFEAGFERFIRQLSDEAKLLGKIAPKILVGFEIANNLYHKHLPSEYAVDLYGTSYPDVPSPCSKLFWDEEVVQPLRDFCKFFKDKKLQNSARLGGLVIDCELYGRVNTSSFGSLMMCDSVLVEAFCKDLGLAVVPSNFFEWLLAARKTDALMAFAARQVRERAAAIKAEVNKWMPGAVVGCYAPVVCVDWFLSNFCGSLGSGAKPLELFTFNTSFDRIRSVVERMYGLKINHSTVMMLSKFTGPQDYALLDRAFEGNDGYWFNRWSRLAELQDPAAWHVIEQPGLVSAEDKMSFYAKIFSH